MAITTYNFSASTTTTKEKEKEKEHRWVDQVSKKFIREVAIDISDANPICVFNIPGSISIFKPEAYLPHLIALGPYHHMDPNLYHMQRYKIASAKSFFYHQTPHSCEKNFRDSLINKLKQLDPVVRGCYHSYLDFDDITLSWIVAIDGLFLVNLLQQYYYNFFAGAADLQNKNATILSRDLLLLENQIPFVVLRQIYNNPSEDQSDDELILMMDRFCRANSPLQFMSSSISPNERIRSPLHLLDLMYHLIIVNNNIANSPHQIQDDEVINIESNQSTEESEESEVVADEEDINSACDNIGEITKVAMKFGLAIKILKPVQVIQNIPWDKLLSIIGLKTVIKDPAGKLDEGRPVVEEIKIPSVSSLHYYAGITFRSTSEGGIRSIKFEEEEEAVLYLPPITLDVNSEVIFRNLVAYETAMNYSTTSGYLSFSEFVDLISGIIDNAEDARLLKEKGIIKGNLTNDEIAELFNGMNKAARNSGNKSSTSVVKKINNYYKKRVVVKMFKFMKKRWFSLWKVITHVLTVLLLLLLVLYSFCVFYGCPKIFGSSSSS